MFLLLNGMQWSDNARSLPRASDDHTDLTAQALPRSGFVQEGAKQSSRSWLQPHFFKDYNPQPTNSDR